MDVEFEVGEEDFPGSDEIVAAEAEAALGVFFEDEDGDCFVRGVCGEGVGVGFVGWVPLWILVAAFVGLELFLNLLPILHHHIRIHLRKRIRVSC